MLFRIGLAIAGMLILSIANAAIADDAVVQPNPLPLFFRSVYLRVITSSIPGMTTKITWSTSSMKYLNRRWAT